MSPATLDVSTDGRIRRIEIRRPPLNILDIACMRELALALAAVADGDRAVVITGRPHFSAGADVAEHLPERGDEMLSAFERLLAALAQVPAPTVAVVRGACLGAGFEVATACDLVLVAEDARLAVPEISLGVFPPAAAAMLPERVGAAVAADLVLTGRQLDGCTAAALGLASRAFPESSLESGADEVLTGLARSSRNALRTATLALRASRALPPPERLGRAFSLYRERTLHDPDAIEGLREFLSRRRTARA